MTEGPVPRAQVRSPEDLGRAIAHLRFTHDLTQEELAQRLGISRRYVYEIESGKPNLYALRVFEILNLLGASLTVTHDPAPVEHG
jgi:HTH-type transcriptional regulator/antitoxin HipB